MGAQPLGRGLERSSPAHLTLTSRLSLRKVPAELTGTQQTQSANSSHRPRSAHPGPHGSARNPALVTSRPDGPHGRKEKPKTVPLTGQALTPGTAPRTGGLLAPWRARRGEPAAAQSQQPGRSGPLPPPSPALPVPSLPKACRPEDPRGSPHVASAPRFCARTASSWAHRHPPSLPSAVPRTLPRSAPSSVIVRPLTFLPDSEALA